MTGPPPPTWAIDPGLAGARQVLAGLWRLRLPTAWPGLDHVNAYAIEHVDGLVLVDCGTGGHPSCAAALDVALAQTGHCLRDVRVLVLTHAHSDHVGLAAHVLEASHAELHAHPAIGRSFFDVVREPGRFAAARTERARREGVPPGRLTAFGSVAEEVEGTTGPVVPDRELTDGSRVATALGDWEVLETPGHAASHVLLVQREVRVAIVGDLVCSAFSSWLDYGFSADPLAEAQASLATLRGIGGLDLALPGHGRPMTRLAEVIAEHEKQYLTRLDRLRAALASAPMPLTAFDLSVQLHGESDDLEAVYHLTETVGQLAHLRHRGEVARDERPDGTYVHRAVAPAPVVQ